MVHHTMRVDFIARGEGSFGIKNSIARIDRSIPRSQTTFARLRRKAAGTERRCRTAP